jgi:hypothetical protein
LRCECEDGFCTKIFDSKGNLIDFEQLKDLRINIIKKQDIIKNLIVEFSTI